MKVHNGTQRDAVLFSVGANADHGLRRTNEDKRRAVLTLLKDAEWGSRSDRWIAEKCGVAHSFVADRRAELESDSSSPAHRTGKEGKTRKAPSRPTESKPSKPSKGQLTEEQRKGIRAQIAEDRGEAPGEAEGRAHANWPGSSRRPSSETVATARP